MIIHLTFTGPWAGAAYCGRDDQIRLGLAKGAHPNVRALETPEYRAKVCPTCLEIWDLAGTPADAATGDRNDDQLEMPL